LYERSWQLVRDNYYEPTFNGQDWNQWEHQFDGRIHTTSDAYHAIKLMLDSLNDPYTRLLEPTAFKDESDAMDARIVGIGINLQQQKESHILVVTRTIDDSPAYGAGVVPGDEIVAINGQPAIGLSPEQAAERIRGKAGSNVKITFRNSGAIRTLN